MGMLLIWEYGLLKLILRGCQQQIDYYSSMLHYVYMQRNGAVTDSVSLRSAVYAE
jgi:hypothetical protein